MYAPQVPTASNGTAAAAASLETAVVCWVPMYYEATCAPKMSVDRCMQYQAIGNVYTRWAAPLLCWCRVCGAVS